MGLKEKIVEKNSDIASRVIEGKALIIKSTTRRAYTLNGTGTVIWKSIDNKRSIAELAEIVQKEFNAPRDDAEKDVAEFIKDLNRQRIVLLKG